MCYEMSSTDRPTNVVVSNLHNVGRASDIGIQLGIWSCDFQNLESSRVIWASRDLFIKNIK